MVMIHRRSVLPLLLVGLVGACGSQGSGSDGTAGSSATGSASGGATSGSGGASSGAAGGQTGSSSGGVSSGTTGVSSIVDASTNAPDAKAGTSEGGAGASGSSGSATGSSGSASGRSNDGGAARDATTGATGSSGTSSGATSGATSGASGASCTGPVSTLAGALATGITFTDTDGQAVNAHGGGIIQVGNTYYLHGEYFLSTTTDNNFNGFSMYSSTDLATWKNEGIILPQQPSGELGPDRKGERPHIIKCPATGEYVLYAHAASSDYQTDKEVVYATSATVNGQYAFQGSLTNASGTIAAHSDMSAYADSTGAYVITESGNVYTLASDCHSWLSDQTFSAVNGDSGGSESPTLFKAGSTYYWIGSYKTGWRANNNFYSTAPAVTGPWTYQGFVAPVTDPTNDISDQRTWLTQSTWVQPITGCNGTVYVYWGDHWYGNQDTTAPGVHNYLATYVFQPLVFTGTKIGLPTYLTSWSLNVGAGTWSQ